MKRVLLIVNILILLCFPLLADEEESVDEGTAPEAEASEEISFSGGSSSIVLREGRENVVLSDGATVTVGSMAISADTITLSGDSWRYVSCSGTTSVVARKLGRSYIGIEQNPLYCAWAEYRLEKALSDTTIQGYTDGRFWERNSCVEQLRLKKERTQSTFIDKPTNHQSNDEDNE